MNATVIEGLVEYGTDRPCQVGRITYRVGAHDYVTLALRYLEPLSPWRLTWLGPEGNSQALQLPPGISPSNEMLVALAEATA